MNKFIKFWILLLIVGCFTTLNFSPLYAQKNRSLAEINEAIQKAKNENFEEAKPILEKYSKKKGFDDLTFLEMNVYLNLCKLVEGDSSIDLEAMNKLLYSYINKSNLNKMDSLQTSNQIELFYIGSVINDRLENSLEAYSFLSEIKNIYYKSSFKNITRYKDVFYLLSYIDYNKNNFKSAIENGKLTWELLLLNAQEKSKISLQVLNIIGFSYNSLKLPKDGIEYLEKRVKIAEIMLGETNVDYMSSLGNLALVYSKIPDFRFKALETSLKVVELEKRYLGEKNPQYLNSISNLASLYSFVNDYENALQISEYVVKLQEEILGESDPSFLKSLNDLATAYSNLRKYKEALDIRIKALKIAGSIYGQDSESYMNILNSLSLDYSLVGDLEKERIIRMEFLKKVKEIYGENSTMYLLGINGLASFYVRIGDKGRLNEITDEMLELFKKYDYSSSKEYYRILDNISEIYISKNDFENALNLSLQAVEISKNILGERSNGHLWILSHLALIYQNLNNYAASFEVYSKVINLGKDVWGETSPYYLKILNQFALFEFKQNKYNSAYFYKSQGIILLQNWILDSFSTLTETQREMFFNNYKFLIYYLATIVENSQNQNSVAFLFNFILFQKGLLLNASIEFESFFIENGLSHEVSKLVDLKNLRMQIGKLKENPDYKQSSLLDSLQTVSANLELDLISISKVYGDYTQNLKMTWKDIQINLGEKDVAIEFIYYPTLDDSIKYAALVLRKGWSNPKFVPLFRKDQINELIRLDKNQIYSNGYVGKEIRNLVWSPLEEFISSGDRIYFSAAGIIHQLAIENLPFDEASTLGDHYEMRRLSSTKELVIKKPESKSKSVALYGGIKYDLALDSMLAEGKKYERRDGFLALRGISQDTAVRKGWQFLDGTLEEAIEVSRILNQNNFQVSEFIGEVGSEESFKDLSGKKPGIIHVATHGFFLPIEESERNKFVQMRLGDENESRGYVDPMLRSGLMLAGGNMAWQGDSIPDTIEDGVLTAKEISHIDLRGTDLVVLSACETGLGDVSSEGVFGLQRAFKQAGAQTIIMSLWNVKDEATQFLMTNFYSYLMQGASKREAFIQARNKCREQYQDPASWAAFIMLD
jgi:hypothetical protein